MLTNLYLSNFLHYYYCKTKLLLHYMVHSTSPSTSMLFSWIHHDCINVESSCLFILHRKHDHQILIDLMLLFWRGASRSKSCHMTCSCGSQTRFHLKITHAFLWQGLCLTSLSLSLCFSSHSILAPAGLLAPITKCQDFD